MGHKKTVALTFNLKGHGKDSDHDEEYDEIETVEFLESQLKTLGSSVVLLEQNDRLFDDLRRLRPAFVMNIAEGKGKSRNRESQVPALLDWLGIPFYGSDALAMGVTLDKGLTHKVLKNSGVDVPEMFIVKSGLDFKRIKNIFDGRQFIVKPRWEGSSKGIFNDSVVDNIDDCKKKGAYILKTYQQPCVVEEFLCGEEVTVALIGNGTPEVFGMMRIVQRQKTETFVYSLENKRNWRKTIKYELAQNSVACDVLERMEKSAQKAFAQLELRDIARIDFRLDNKGIPKIIDVNPLPGLSPVYSDLMLMSKLRGLLYPGVVQTIIKTSLKRNRMTL